MLSRSFLGHGDTHCVRRGLTRGSGQIDAPAPQHHHTCPQTRLRVWGSVYEEIKLRPLFHGLSCYRLSLAGFIGKRQQIYENTTLHEDNDTLKAFLISGLFSGFMLVCHCATADSDQTLTPYLNNSSNRQLKYVQLK